MLYVTRDSIDGGLIRRGAIIHQCVTETEAYAYLLKDYYSGEWDRATAEIGPGRFSDYWLIFNRPPPDIRSHYLPFGPHQISILKPGQHPGGPVYWVLPQPDVLVVKAIRLLD